jgi:hypothetical protein
MLSKCRCPHTGVVNFFTKADPLLAVGSVAEAGSARYAWHCYVGEQVSGLAPDMSLAEAYLRKAIASGEQQAGGHRDGGRANAARPPRMA